MGNFPKNSRKLFVYTFTENFLTKKLRGKVCILRNVYFSVHFHSCCFYIQYHRGIREITSMPVKVFCFILTRCRNIRFFYTTFVLIIQKRRRFEPGPPSLLFVATPLLQVWRFSFRMTLSLFANWSKIRALFNWNNYLWDDSSHFLKFHLLLPKFINRPHLLFFVRRIKKFAMTWEVASSLSLREKCPNTESFLVRIWTLFT